MILSFSHFEWKLKLGTQWILLNYLYRYSIIITNDNGEIGSPCLNPLLATSFLEWTPLILNWYVIVVTSNMIKPMNLLGKPISFKVVSRSFQSTVSYAFWISFGACTGGATFHRVPFYKLIAQQDVVMDFLTRNKHNLAFADNEWENFSQSNIRDLIYVLIDGGAASNGLVISNSFSSMILGEKSDKSSIDGLVHYAFLKEILGSCYEIIFDNTPRSFKKKLVSLFWCFLTFNLFI